LIDDLANDPAAESVEVSSTVLSRLRGFLSSAEKYQATPNRNTTFGESPAYSALGDDMTPMLGSGITLTATTTTTATNAGASSFFSPNAKPEFVTLMDNHIVAMRPIAIIRPPSSESSFVLFCDFGVYFELMNA